MISHPPFSCNTTTHGMTLPQTLDYSSTCSHSYCDLHKAIGQTHVYNLGFRCYLRRVRVITHLPWLRYCCFSLQYSCLPSDNVIPVTGICSSECHHSLQLSLHSYRDEAIEKDTITPQCKSSTIMPLLSQQSGADVSCMS